MVSLLETALSLNCASKNTPVRKRPRIATVGTAHFLNRGETHKEVLRNAGAGLEYRFTPHIGFFSDAR